MGGFFRLTTAELKRLEAISAELSKVNALIERANENKKMGGYSVPKLFSLSWVLYTASGGDVMQEKFIRENYRRVDMLERVLMKQIETLKTVEK